MSEHSTIAAAGGAREADPFFGKYICTDGHIYFTPELYKEVMGTDEGGSFVMDFVRRYYNSDKDKAERARNREALWEVKGISAMGAVIPEERVEALDLMGVRSQLLFPPGGGEFRFNSEQARHRTRLLNDYALDFQRRGSGRLKVVCQLNMHDPAWTLAEAERIIKAGARAIQIPTAVPPAGVSPAHSTWDPLWALMAEADVPVILHLGGAALLQGDEATDPAYPARAWGNAEALRKAPPERAGGDEAISPYFILVTHQSPEVFLTTMVMGGVFERHENLRMGILEYGTMWIGPAVERMDSWVDFMAKVGNHYKLKPSETVRKHVRVGPFWHEDIPTAIDRYGMKEIYCFSTDYPHLEGSKDPIGRFKKKIEPLGEAYQQEFFVENAKLLFPELA
jgi:predicted TIM-barrel fold metal-dependent hydrolase